MYLLPGGGIPAWNRSAGGGSARNHLWKLRARTLVADLLKIQQKFGQISAPPYGVLHIPVWEQICCLLKCTLSTEIHIWKHWKYDSEDSTQTKQWGLSQCIKVWCLGVELKAHTRPVHLSPHSAALSSGCLSHKTWSTETECRQEGQFFRKWTLSM